MRENYPGKCLGKRFLADLENLRKDGPLLKFTFEHHAKNKYGVRRDFQYEPLYVGSTFPVYLTGNVFEIPDYLGKYLQQGA